jgi:hypothetical protein
VRAGRITLAQAQRAIVQNWTIALRRLGRLAALQLAGQRGLDPGQPAASIMSAPWGLQVPGDSAAACRGCARRRGRPPFATR